jgi:hypothetical protein
VVLQADELLSLSTVIIAPTSARAHPASFRPEVEIDGQPRVLVDQLGSIQAGSANPTGYSRLVSFVTSIARWQ